MNIQRVRKQVIILGAVLLLLLCVPVGRLEGIPASWPFFLVTGYVLMSIHWWMLSNLISSVFSGEKTLTVLWGMLALFPLALALGLCFVAGRICRALLIPASAGILSVPFAVTLYCIVTGAKGLLSHS